MKRQLRCREAFAFGEYEAKRTPFPLRAAKPRFTGRKPCFIVHAPQVRFIFAPGGVCEPITIRRYICGWFAFDFDGSSKKGYGECRTGISPLANIPTPFALQASSQIFGRGMRTHIKVRCTLIVFALKGHQKRIRQMPYPFFGDPYGNRTHVTAVKGPCLNRLTNGP